MKKWLIAAMIFLAAAAAAQAEERLEPAQKKSLNTFFSNFSEAGVESFRKGGLSDPIMLDFALVHIYKNKFKSLKKTKDGGSVIVPAALVDTATIKYFGRKVGKHQSESYTIPMADGEAYVFSQISRLSKRGEALFEAEGVIYSAGSGATPNPHGTPAEWKKKGIEVTRAATFSALIQEDSERYILLEYTVK